MASNSTSSICSVKLEILRPGPAHNQLLSPLTSYLALCGEEGPVTIRFPFEHRHLLARLGRLAYPEGIAPADDRQRQAEVREMGEVVGGIFGTIPPLLTELWRASASNAKHIHLQLVLNNFELGMIPFEMAVAPAGFPAVGSPLFIQSTIPISIVRQIRRGKPLPLNWNRAPKILFVVAAPAGLPVPAQEHLQALREAIEPWVKLKDSKEERLKDVKELLTILPDASLRKIRKACAENEYTHVHILAHGAPLNNGVDNRFGLVLHSEYGTASQVVDGESLAFALTSNATSGDSQNRPTVVTLATCDSGNINSVITPGGSIAHELHAAGTPWVIASQFPLWMQASAIAVEVLYKGLLAGKDPRRLLCELRQRLRTEAMGTHDWASIVAYSTEPPDFDKQVEAFRNRQTKRKIEVMFDRIDSLLKVNILNEIGKPKSLSEAHKQEIDYLRESIRKDYELWRNEPASLQDKKESAERFGLSAASEKRFGIAYAMMEKKKSEMEDEKEDEKKAFLASKYFYQEAMHQDPTNHWVITQYLSISAVLVCCYGKADMQEQDIQDMQANYAEDWRAVNKIAQWNLVKAEGEKRIWALGTLAELLLLKPIYKGISTLAETAEDMKLMQAYCKEIVSVAKTLSDSFPLFSTRRQFLRYKYLWDNDVWRELVDAAVKILGT